MTNSPFSECSDQMTRLFLEGAEEVLGAEQLNRLVKEITPEGGELKGEPQNEGIPLTLADAGPLLWKLESLYGAASGRGLAVRIGRSVFKYGLQQYGDQAGFHAVEFRLLPSPRRIAAGLQLLAQALGEACHDTITVTDGDTYWLWQSQHCPICRDHTSPDPCCYLVIGLLQEFAAWAGGGRFYPVTETTCRASGGPSCEYRIEKKPLD